MSHVAISIETTTNLYHRFPGQTSAQPCYVSLDPASGALSTDWSGQVGAGVPEAVWHHRVLRWKIPALRESAQAALLAKLVPLAERICAGHSVEWDGSNNVGRLTDDAAAANQEAALLCSSYSYENSDSELVVWEASDWYASLGSHEAQAEHLGIAATTSDEQLDAIAREQLEEASAEGVAELENLERHLRDLRTCMQDCA